MFTMRGFSSSLGDIRRISPSFPHRRRRVPVKKTGKTFKMTRGEKNKSLSDFIFRRFSPFFALSSSSICLKYIGRQKLKRVEQVFVSPDETFGGFLISMLENSRIRFKFREKSAAAMPCHILYS